MKLPRIAMQIFNNIFCSFFFLFLVESLKQEATNLQENAFDNAHKMTDSAYGSQMNLAKSKFNQATRLEGKKKVSLFIRSTLNLHMCVSFKKAQSRTIPKRAL